MAQSNAKKGRKYESGLEASIAKQLQSRGIEFDYESIRIPYTIPATEHKYTPDFRVVTPSGKEIIIESKGIWTYDDRYKHLLIRKEHPELDIRFVFTRSKTKISKGSKTTYADICEGRGRGRFRGVVWMYADKRIPTEWLKE